MTAPVDKKSSVHQIIQAVLDVPSQSISTTADVTTSIADPIVVRLTDGVGYYNASNSFTYDGNATLAVFDTAVPANNRGVPQVLLKGEGAGAFVAGQAASTESFPVVLSTEQQTVLTDIKTSVQLLDDTISTNVHTGIKELNVTANGHICTNNSTDVELLGGQTFTGSAWQDCLNYGTIIVSVSTDQNSATDGLVVQWSADGVAVMDTDSFTILANNPKSFSFGTSSRYIRVIYTNGATLQGSFILQTMLKPGYTKPSSHRIDQAIVGQDDAELVKAVLTGKNPAGNFVNVTTTTAGNLKTSLEEIDPGALGQEPMATSLPVVIASNQSEIAVKAGTNLNTSALALETGGNLAVIAGDTTSIDGKITACDTTGLALETGGNLDTIAGDTTSIDAKIPGLWDTDKIPVNVMNTDLPLRWDTQEYTDAATTITIVYKFSTATVMTRTITWASAALKTAGALPATNVVVLAGA